MPDRASPRPDETVAIRARRRAGSSNSGELLWPHEPRRHRAAEKRTRPPTRSTASTSRPELSQARDWACREPAGSFAHHAGHVAADRGSPPTRRSISSNVISMGPSSARHRCWRSGSYFATTIMMPRSFLATPRAKPDGHGTAWHRGCGGRQRSIAHLLESFSRHHRQRGP